MVVCSTLWLSSGRRSVGVVCVAYFLLKIVPLVWLSPGLKYLLAGISTKSCCILSYLLLTSSGSHSRSSSILVTHPGVLVEKSVEDVCSRTSLDMFLGFDVGLLVRVPDR